MNIKSPDLRDIPALKLLWKEAFGDGDAFVDLFFETAFDKTRALILENEGNICGALYWFSCEFSGNPVAYIYGVATAKKFRGQGVCHRLMEYAHKYLLDEGYKCAVLVPGSRELFELYSGMGYEVCGYISELTCECGERAAEVRVIDKAEYAKLRRKYIPDGGVVQEKETLDFLEKQVEFFAGKDCVFAGVKGNDVFLGIEILGDTSEASGIVKSLGCTRGKFRTIGNDKPFAMYISLDKSISEKPQYFGLALD